MINAAKGKEYYSPNENTVVTESQTCLVSDFFYQESNICCWLAVLNRQKQPCFPRQDIWQQNLNKGAAKLGEILYYSVEQEILHEKHKKTSVGQPLPWWYWDTCRSHLCAAPGAWLGISYLTRSVHIWSAGCFWVVPSACFKQKSAQQEIASRGGAS